MNFISFLSFTSNYKNIEYRIRNARKITLYSIIYKNKNKIQSLWFSLSTNTILLYFNGTVSILSKNLKKREREMLDNFKHGNLHALLYLSF